MLPAASVGISVSFHWALPFLFPFHANILQNGIPALMIGSMNIPHPPPEAIIAFPAPDIVCFGLPNVLMNGIPAITMFMPAIHPGFPPTFVASGWANILIG
jgi:hypothetical protein